MIYLIVSFLPLVIEFVSIEIESRILYPLHCWCSGKVLKKLTFNGILVPEALTYQYGEGISYLS